MKKKVLWSSLLLTFTSTLVVGCGMNGASSPTLRMEEVPAIIEETTIPPEPIATPEYATSKVDLLMIGDMLCHEGVYHSGYFDNGTVNFDHIFANTKEDIEAADLAIVNQETMLGGLELGLSGYPCFNSPYEIGDSLVNAGFDVVLSATNHTLDRGMVAIDNALSFWKEKHPEIAVLGMHDADFTDYSTQDIYVYEQNGIKIAILNYTYGTNGIPVPADRPLVVNMLDEEKIAMDVKKAKELANFVVVCPHWGTEYVYKPDYSQLHWTEYFYNLGVDLVIGAHPHVLENIEWIEKEDNDHRMLVYYSLGNFVSNQDEKPRMLGGMAKVQVAMEPKTSIDAETLKKHGCETVTVEFPENWKGKENVAIQGELDANGNPILPFAPLTEDDFYVINGALTEKGSAECGFPAGSTDGEELAVYIKDAAIEPIVNHKLFGPGRITVYKLKDYTDELAAKNAIHADANGGGFSVQYLKDLCKEILGDWYVEE